MTFSERSKNSNIFLISGATVVILFAIAISTIIQIPNQEQLYKVITVGPVWDSDSWRCTSDSDFMVYATLRGIGNAQLEITIENVGKQSLYTINPGELESFSIGSSAGNDVIITRTGVVTGFITLQTSSGSAASCSQT